MENEPNTEPEDVKLTPEAADQGGAQRIQFKGLRRYWSDKAVWSFDIIFDLAGFLKQYPQFSDSLTAESIAGEKSMFNEIAAGCDPQAEVSAVTGVLSYLMYFQETDEQIESFQALVDDPLSQYEQFFVSSGKEESTPLEQDWMIMSIEAL